MYHTNPKLALCAFCSHAVVDRTDVFLGTNLQHCAVALVSKGMMGPSSRPHLYLNSLMKDRMKQLRQAGGPTRTVRRKGFCRQTLLRRGAQRKEQDQRRQASFLG